MSTCGSRRPESKTLCLRKYSVNPSLHSVQSHEIYYFVLFLFFKIGSSSCKCLCPSQGRAARQITVLNPSGVLDLHTGTKDFKSTRCAREEKKTAVNNTSTQRSDADQGSRRQQFVSSSFNRSVCPISCTATSHFREKTRFVFWSGAVCHLYALESKHKTGVLPSSIQDTITETA